MNLYTQLKEKHMAEINAFPLGAAFSQEDFDEMMKKFGLKPYDVKAIHSIGYNMYCKKEDKDAFYSMLAKHQKEVMTAIEDKETGEKFAYDMFCTEFMNHECGYTGEFEEALSALPLTVDMVLGNSVLSNAFAKAKSAVLAAF